MEVGSWELKRSSSQFILSHSIRQPIALAVYGPISVPRNERGYTSVEISDTPSMIASVAIRSARLRIGSETYQIAQPVIAMM